MRLFYSTQPKAALEAERAIHRIPAAAEWISAVAAFAASVWHGPGSLVRKELVIVPLQSEAARPMLQPIA
jgi:hypothetical protein